LGFRLTSYNPGFPPGGSGRTVTGYDGRSFPPSVPFPFPFWGWVVRFRDDRTA